MPGKGLSPLGVRGGSGPSFAADRRVLPFRVRSVQAEPFLTTSTWSS
jgi:hypothetical protein